MTSAIHASILISMLNLYLRVCKQQFTPAANTYSGHCSSRHRHAPRFWLPVLTRILGTYYRILFV